MRWRESTKTGEEEAGRAGCMTDGEEAVRYCIPWGRALWGVDERGYEAVECGDAECVVGGAVEGEETQDSDGGESSTPGRSPSERRSTTSATTYYRRSRGEFGWGV